MRISDWSSDVCSSDLIQILNGHGWRQRGVLHPAGGSQPLPGLAHHFHTGHHGVLSDIAVLSETGQHKWIMWLSSHGGSLSAIVSEKNRMDTCSADRKSVVQGKRFTERVDRGGRRIFKKKKKK